MLNSVLILVIGCPCVGALKVSRAHDVTLPMRSAEQDLFALHIGKTGMTSLCLENRKAFAPLGTFHVENKCTGYSKKGPYARSHILETCLPLLHHEGAFHFTLLREPRAWAVSAFTHCIGMSKDPFFKALEYNNWSETAFLKWLEHFANDRWADRNGVDDALHLRDSWAGDAMGLLGNRSLNCYNPRNFQSEALTCQSNGTFHHVPTSRPSRKAVEDSLQTQLQFVGVAELYDESACLLHYQLNATLLPWCSCDYFGVKEPSMEKLLAWHPDERKADHSRRSGRPHHPDVTTLSSDTLEAIDDITDVDRDMYRIALKLFLLRLRKLEKMHDTQLICPAQMLKLQEKLPYLDVQGLLSTFMNA